MVFSIAIEAEICVLCHTIDLSRFWWNFSAVITEGSFGLLFFIGVYYVVYDVDGEDLVILENHVLVLEHLRVFFLVVEIDRLEAFGAIDGLIDEFALAVAVGLTYRDLVHYAADLFLCVSDAVEANVKDHAGLREFVPFLANFEQFIRFVELFVGEEGFQDDASFGVATEGRTEMCARNIVYLFDNCCAGSQGKLQFKLYQFPLIGANLYFRVFLQKAFFVTRHG